MDIQRRRLAGGISGAVLLSALAAAGITLPGTARAARQRAAFAAETVAEALQALGAAAVTAGGEVEVNLPELAENGASVPIGVSTTLPDVSLIALLVEKNPTILAASFRLPPGTEASIQTRIKMAETSPVHVLIRSGERFYLASREVQVVLGGCGQG